MAVNALMLANIFIFSAKIVIELSIGVNKITNLLEAFNLTMMLFAFFISVTLKSLTLVKDYTLFDPVSQSKFMSFQTIVDLKELQTVFLGVASFFYPFRLFQFLAHFKLFKNVRIFINIIYRMTPVILV